MDICSKIGSKVKFARVKAGYKHHQETAEKHLKLGETYEVERIDTGGWHTDVYLKEVPNVSFNSVMFVNV